MTRKRAQKWIEITAKGLWPAPSLYCGIEGPDRVPPQEDEVNMCMAWIQLHARKTTDVRRRHTSWGFIKAVFYWTRTLPGGEFPVSNGAFIEAARRLGYEIRQHRKDSPNACFNMSFGHLGKWKDVFQGRTGL
jgi:hypothetical protein